MGDPLTRERLAHGLQHAYDKGAELGRLVGSEREAEPMTVPHTEPARELPEVTTERTEQFRVTYEGNDYEDFFPSREEAEEWMQRWKNPILHHRTRVVVTIETAWGED